MIMIKNNYIDVCVCVLMLTEAVTRDHDREGREPPLELQHLRRHAPETRLLGGVEALVHATPLAQGVLHLADLQVVRPGEGTLRSPWQRGEGGEGGQRETGRDNTIVR